MIEQVNIRINLSGPARREPASEVALMLRRLAVRLARIGDLEDQPIRDQSGREVGQMTVANVIPD